MLFSTMGYRVVNQYMAEQSDMVLESQLDEHQYREKDLVSIKVPLTIPYYSNTKQFERVDGELKVNGIIYKYVKRRIFQDTLELLCIVNTTKMNLQSAREQFFELCYEFQHSKTSKKTTSSVEKNIQLEYLTVSTDASIQFSITTLKNNANINYLLSYPSILKDDKPPEDLKSIC